MAKAKTYVKEETVKRIKNLLKKYSKEELLESTEFNSLCTHYINGFEREHLDTIVNLCCEGREYDEIRFMIQGETAMSNKPKTKKENIKEEIEEMDPVEKETIFMINQQKVVEVESVSVTIGEDEDETQNDATNKVVNAESKDNEPDVSEPVLLKDIINEHKTDNKKKDKKSAETVNKDKPAESKPQFNEYTEKARKYFEEYKKEESKKSDDKKDTAEESSKKSNKIVDLPSYTERARQYFENIKREEENAKATAKANKKINSRNEFKREFRLANVVDEAIAKAEKEWENRKAQ